MLSRCVYFHCRIEEAGSPNIIFINCHRVLCYPLQHVTRWMEKYLLAKAHITKLNQWQQLEVTNVTTLPMDDTVLAILKRQRSWGITIVSSQRKFICDIVILAMVTEWTDKTLQTGSYRLYNIRISPRYLESLPDVMLCFCKYSMERYMNPGANTVI